MIDRSIMEKQWKPISISQGGPKLSQSMISYSLRKRQSRKYKSYGGFLRRFAMLLDRKSALKNQRFTSRKMCREIWRSSLAMKAGSKSQRI